MAKNKVVEQIEELKKRSHNWRNDFQVTQEVVNLGRDWKQLSGSKSTFDAFIPIRLVTCIEVMVRHFVRKLVDHDKLYADRSIQLLKNTKPDFEFLLGLHGQRITLGEIVSHTIGLNNLDQIIGTLEALDTDLVQEFPKLTDRWAIEISGEPNVPIVRDVDKNLSDIRRLLTVRHILTHELPIDPPFDSKDLEDFLSSTYRFLNALSWRLDYLINGNSPLTQLDMNMKAGVSATEAQQEMEAEFQLLQETKLFDVDLLHIAQTEWLQHVEADCQLVASQVSGGSMYPMIFASAKESMFRTRAYKLRHWREREEGDMGW